MHLNIEEIRDILFNDKRRFERLKVPIKITYSLTKTSSPKTEPIPIEDIGGGGLRFNTFLKLKKAEKIKLTLYFPKETEKPISTKGEVVWCKKISDKPQLYTVGVNFLRMNKKDKERLIFFLCDNIISFYLPHKRKS